MQVCAALADPIRTSIVELLAGRDLSAGEIAERFDVSRPAVSRHLRVLRQSDLVSVRGEAQRRVYSLNPEPLDDLAEWVSRHRQRWEARLDALGKHLDEMEGREARDRANTERREKGSRRAR